MNQTVVSKLAFALFFMLLPIASQGQTELKLYPGESLPQLRGGFQTQLLKQVKNGTLPPLPPAGYILTSYPAPLGSNAAYVTEPPVSGKKYPAIIWLAGGFDNSIDETPWTPATPDDDQSASAFQKAGVITMYPSLRGGNQNPGYIEECYGEIDDVLAAAKYLAALPFVDPNRIYLGGHSTGGTLALLVDESESDVFRAVFAFGPIDHFGAYGAQQLNFDYQNSVELSLRSPIYCLDSVTSPTFVFEGTNKPSNIDPLIALSAKCSNPVCHFYELPGYDHFSELAAFTPVLAAEIAADKGASAKFSFLHTQPKAVPAPQD